MLTASSLVGINLGKADVAAAKHFAKVVAAVCSASMLLLCLVSFLLRNSIAGLFSIDDGVVNKI